MYVDSDFNGTAWSDQVESCDFCIESRQVVATELQNAFEDLLVKYDVDLCLWGHHHSYQR